MEPKVSRPKQSCGCCGKDTPSRYRDFNEDSWQQLIAWGEVAVQAKNQPLCNVCYSDLRDVLIDHSIELQSAPLLESPVAAKTPDPVRHAS